MTRLGEHLLGRVEPPDLRHAAMYPFAAPPARPQGIEVNLKRPTLDLYDQGNTPRCVAYSTSKVMNFFNHYRFDADWLYAECKKIDPWPGQDGTHARFACDVLRTQGHWRVIRDKPVKAGPKLAHGIELNYWAASVDAIRTVFAKPNPEPVLLGIDWYDAWFEPVEHKYANAGGTSGSEFWLQSIPTAGRPVGGHEIGIWACSDRRQAFGLSNTWGRAWPDLVWVSYADVQQLLDQGGDACVIGDRVTR